MQLAQNVFAPETPADRLATLGYEALASVELVALLIGGNHDRALRVAAELLARDGVHGLGAADVVELRRRGATAAAAARIVAALELGRRNQLPRKQRLRIESPEDLAKFLGPRYRDRDRECFGVVLLDSRNGVLGRRVISIGTLSASLVHPRELFLEAVRAQCARFAMFHCHPSSVAEASPEDIALTRRMLEVGKLMGIDVVDHIVIGQGFVSLRSSRPDLPW